VDLIEVTIFTGWASNSNEVHYHSLQSLRAGAITASEMQCIYNNGTVPILYFPYLRCGSIMGCNLREK